MQDTLTFLDLCRKPVLAAVHGTVADGLNYIATWNAAMLMSNDLQDAMMANMGKRGAVFKD